MTEKPRILIVDDERFDIAVLLEALQGLCRPTVAKTGEQALRRARAHPPPDLIMLDVTMPDISGYEVCRRLKADPATCAIPILFVTGLQDDEELLMGMKSGALDVVMKPLNTRLLRARVTNLLQLLQTRGTPPCLGAAESAKPGDPGLMPKLHGRPSVLIADDEPFLLNVLHEALDDEFTVISASSGHEALQKVHEEPRPELIILDIVMPELDGYEVCKALKEDERTRDIPVVFLTVMGHDTNEYQGLNLGAIDYLVKPINPAIVKARVRNHLRLRQAMREAQQRRGELERANEELGRAMASVKNLNEHQRFFLGTAAHDLRSPLTSIYNFALTLQESEEQGEPIPAAERIDLARHLAKVSKHMIDVVDNMLTTDYLDSGQLKIDLVKCHLTSLVDPVVALNRPRAIEKNQELIYEAERTVSATIDPTRMREVVDNLVSNAIKFSPAGKRIWIRVRQTAEHAVIEVQDEGPGLSEADRGKLFGKFVRLSPQPTGGERSTGLGLYLSKRLVDLHGGEIRVTSHPGQGATFTICLH